MSASFGALYFFQSSPRCRCHYHRPCWEYQYPTLHGTQRYYPAGHLLHPAFSDVAALLGSWAGSDTGLPVITAPAPSNVTLSTTTPTLRGQFVTGASPIELSTVRLSLDGQIQSGAVITSGGFSLAMGSALAEGDHQATVSLTNTANLTGQTVWYFTTDSQRCGIITPGGYYGSAN